METRTIHSNENGEQVTRRVVEHQGETYEFEVDLDAVDDDEADGHVYEGDREEIPVDVELALGEYGAGAAPNTGSDGGKN